MLKFQKKIFSIISAIFFVALIISVAFFSNITRRVFAADLAALVASSGPDIYLTNGTYTFIGNLVIPAGKNLHFERGAEITIGSGQTLFINGGMDDPRYRIFNDRSGDLSKGVKFANGNIIEVRPEWWGGTTTGEQTDGPAISDAIEKAIYSHADFHGTVIFGSGTYHTNRAIRLRGSTSLKGEGDGTNIRPINFISDINLIEDSAIMSDSESLQISDISLRGAYATADVIHFSNGAKNVTIKNCSFVPEIHGWDINITNGKNILIRSNNIGGGAEGALEQGQQGLISAGGSGIKIENNEMAGGYNRFHIALGSCADCEIKGNIITNDWGVNDSVDHNYILKGINIANSPNFKIISNRIDGEDYGIFINSSSGDIFSNRILRHSLFAIYSENGWNGINIEGNSISDVGNVQKFHIVQIFGNSSGWEQFFVNPAQNYLVFKDNFSELLNVARNQGTIEIAKLDTLEKFWLKYGQSSVNKGNGVRIEGSCEGGSIRKNDFSDILIGSLDVRCNSSSGNYPDANTNAVAPANFGTYAILASSPSPSVAHSVLFKTANESPVSFTDFNKAFQGKEIFILFRDNNTTVKFSGSNLRGNNGLDWKPTDGDHMRCTKEANFWNCSVFNDTGLATSVPPPADLNSDTRIDLTDFNILKTDFLKLADSLANPKSDINGDGQATIRDIGIMMSQWKP